MKQKHVDKTLSSVVFLADFHICDSHRGEFEDLFQEQTPSRLFF